MSDVIRPGAEPGPLAERLSGARVTAVDWGAILAGVAVVTAISFVMAAFGSGIGMSLASPYTGASPMTHTIALALWVLWVTVASYVAGGYVCGRLRRRNVDMPREEAEVRDGAHGLVVWATAMIIVALAAGSSLYSLGKAGVNAAVEEAQKSGFDADPVTNRVDALLRGDGAQRGPGASTLNPAETRQIVSRLVARAQASGELSQEDRTYLANLLPGGGRVDAIAQQIRDDHARAKDLADKARKAGIVGSFIAGAAMVLAAASAWGGATLGGRHRDENIGLSDLTRW